MSWCTQNFDIDTCVWTLLAARQWQLRNANFHNNSRKPCQTSSVFVSTWIYAAYCVIYCLGGRLLIWVCHSTEEKLSGVQCTPVALVKLWHTHTHTHRTRPQWSINHYRKKSVRSGVIRIIGEHQTKPTYSLFGNTEGWNGKGFELKGVKRLLSK